jgi:hypothetical protein
MKLSSKYRENLWRICREFLHNLIIFNAFVESCLNMDLLWICKLSDEFIQFLLWSNGTKYFFFFFLSLIYDRFC